MEETAPAPPATAPAAPTPRSIGERLRAGRERAGLSLLAAAEKLHLDPKVIEALEADRFADLGASVYVRGHLRRYGDFVGEPGAELVNLYAAREARAPSPDLTQVPQAERRADPRRLARPLVGVGSALVIALAIWWVLAGQGSGKKTVPAPVAQPAATSAPVENPAAVAALGATPAGTPAVQPVSAPASAGLSASGVAASGVAASVVSPADTAAAAAVPERREEAPVRPTQLRLELSSESWVEVYDSRGQRLYYDVASSGSVQSIEGRPPLRVVLGNAAAVAVQVNGQSREIPAGAAEGEGARFVVNRSGTLSRSRQ
jgi:cytoskeleton protein RodZ